MSVVFLLFPALLLLIVPLAFVYLWRGRASGPGGFVRVGILLLLALIAAVPVAPLGGTGLDVVVVVDLSRSMPADSRARVLEIVKLIEQQRAAGDRVGIVNVRPRAPHRTIAGRVRRGGRVRADGRRRRQ